MTGTKALKDKLLAQSRTRQSYRQEVESSAAPTTTPSAVDFAQHPGYRQLQALRQVGAERWGGNPFFRTHEGCSGATAVIDGAPYINFASYNYLGLSGDERVAAAASKAVEAYGTSVSASRIVSGERPIHQQLEAEIAKIYSAEDALALVSGHATNVTVIGHLMGSRDLVLHDEYIHNSSLVGAQLSGARRISFRHNDVSHLEQLLRQYRHQFERVLIVVEGLYSMDGDVPDLKALVRLKRDWESWLMVDEAHALGVLGDTGLGSFEHAGVAPGEVDIWMGTLSKTLSSCGGYIAGCQPLIDILRYFAPGFLYSVGMPAMNCAAALESLAIMQAEPERVQRLQQASSYLAEQAQALGFNVGPCIGRAVVPVITGSSESATRLSHGLFERGFNVQPILYPAVPEQSARLRFFVSSEHTREQIDQVLAAMQDCLRAP